MAMGSVISIMILLAILPGGYKTQKALFQRAWWCIKTLYNTAKTRITKWLEAKKKIAKKGANAAKTTVVVVRRKN